MKPPNAIDHAPRKRRLQGALAGFGAGEVWLLRLVFWRDQLAEIPGNLKHRLHRPQPPAIPPVFHRHEHP